MAKFEFEKFKDVGKSYIPKVSLRASGQIGLSSGAIERFEINQEDHKYVVLYYDKQNQIIGIKPIEEPQEGAIKLRYHSGTADISGKSFLEKYQIPYEETKRYNAEWSKEHGMIIVDLKEHLE